MPDEPSADVLGQFARGDHDALHALFRQFEGEIYRWVVRIVRDPSAADDVVVEAFWRAYRGHAKFDPSRSLGAWMRRIATNAARDHLRASRRRLAWTQADDQLLAPASANPDLREAVTRAFSRLSPKLQVVATLALIEQRPYTEIAEALDVPVGTVKSRVFRAVRSLRKELARLGVRR